MFILLNFLLTVTVLRSNIAEWLYPVDHVVTQDGVKLCIIHQTQEHLDLWLWDPVTHEAMKGLLSSYTPAGLSTCPSRNAFCFIDNDRLYIKPILKKGPYALDFMGPYELSKIMWIDDRSFYFSAKERAHYNLFHGTVKGSLCRLTYSKEIDYLYPQKQDELLFFIQRDKKHVHTIVRVEYPMKALESYETAWDQDVPFIEKLSLIAQEESELPSTCSFADLTTAQTLYNHDVPGRALSFLFMESATQGFFIEHAASMNKKDHTIDFSYYELYKADNGWQTRLLFGFSIPSHILFNSSEQMRLYESVYPLLPRVTSAYIYYTSYTDENMHIFSYERATGTATQVSIQTFDAGQIKHMIKTDSYVFAPYFYNGVCYYGGKLIHNDDDSMRDGLTEPKVESDHHAIKSPTFVIEENGIHYIELPYF